MVYCFVKEQIYTMVKQFLYRILCGFFIGLSAFAPGVSGSVIAITMGIYQDLVIFISNPLRELRKRASFIGPLAIGAVLSAIAFVVLFQFFFERHERAVLFAFVGLIAGSLPVIVKEIKKHEFRRIYLVGGTLSLAVAIAIGFVALSVPTQTGAEGHAPFLLLATSAFLAGAIALIPGMSISAIFIMLGVYGRIMDMAETLLLLQSTYLVPMLLLLCAAVFGVYVTSKGIKTAFEKAPGLANMCVLGFMAGSMIGIFAQSQVNVPENASALQSAAVLVGGIFVSLLFVWLGKTVGTRQD